MSEISIDFAGARVDAHGRIIYDPNHPESAKPFLEAFREEEFGKEFEPYWTREAGARVMQVIEEKFPNQPITLAMLGSVTHLLILVHDPAVNPSEPEEEEAPVDDRPRRADGTYKSEFEIFADTHSMSEIRTRAASDRNFGDWFRGTYKNQTIQEGPFHVLAGYQPAPSQSSDLETFVNDLSKMSAADRKPIGGFIRVGQRRYTVEQFRHQTDLAISAGLL